MKTSIYTAAIILFSTVAGKTIAQNIPDGSAVSGSSPLPGIISPPKDYNQSPNVAPSLFNYNRTFTPLIPMTSVPHFDNTQSMPILVNTDYLDGRGTTILNISRNNSTTDVVTPVDNRVSLTRIGYLPYTKPYHSKFHSNVFTEQQNYYGTFFSIEDATGYSVNKTFSDQGKPTNVSYNPGLSFVGMQRGSMTQSNINISDDNVFIVTYSSGNICKVGTYAAGQLWKMTTTGQHNQQSITYTNKSNQLICKRNYIGGTVGNNGWYTTYYVYDDMGRLIFVLPPKACEQFNSNNCISDVDKLCYSYQYDEYGRIKTKGTPGKTSTEDIVYDKFGEAMLGSNPLMKQNNQWSFSIYDKLDRVVMSGVYTGTETQSYFQGVANGTTTPVSHGVSADQTLEYWLTNRFSGSNYPSSLFGCEIQVYYYYDDYSLSLFNTYPFDNSCSTDYLSGAEMVTPSPYMVGHGKLVASKTKILDDGVANNFVNTWITSVFYYDEKGSLIQTQTHNPWNATNKDINVTQYNFAGLPVLNISKHYSWNNNNKPSTKIQTRNFYNYNSGRLEQVKQKIDTFAWQPITVLTYDNLGNVKIKNMGGAEVQHYSHNIRGQVTGINAAHLNTPNSGLINMTYLSEINYDAGFTQKRYDGGISGFVWRTPSTDKMAYGYSYDNVARTTHTEFREYNTAAGGGTTWNKTNTDYTVSNISYDANGNMLTMNQRGDNNSLAPDDIDILSYTYDVGNQLTKVTDGGVASPIMDFDNGSSGTNTDYLYDVNGNLMADANKAIDSIIYNRQDLPLRVKKGSDFVKNIYDAGGTLIQKTISENSTTVNYRYWGPFVYKNDSLQYVLHGEGRTRWLADSNKFKYDFFVKDHLGNVRTTVTADVTSGVTTYSASFETAYANVEEAIFDNLAPVRDLNPSGTPQDLECAHLDGSVDSLRIGAAILLHGMAGDQLNLHTYAYYESMDSTTLSTYATPEAMSESLINALSNSINNIPNEGTGIPISAPVINNLLSPSNYNQYESIKSSITNPSYPKMYLNYMVFDEDMNLLPDECHAIQLTGAANTWHKLELPAPTTLGQNGYVLTYVSNETAGPTYANNSHIINIKGRLLEEKLYYPHGLLVDLGTQSSLPYENKYLYQGKQLQTELGMELYDFHARQYDAQIGRFWGIDPMDQFPSGYTGMGNDPANNIDPSGMYAMSSSEQSAGYLGIMEYNRRLRDQEEYAKTLSMFMPSEGIPNLVVNYMGSTMGPTGDDYDIDLESPVDKMVTIKNAEGDERDVDPSSYENISDDVASFGTEAEKKEREEVKEAAEEVIESATEKLVGDFFKPNADEGCQGCVAKKKSGWIDKLQTGLDLVGIGDPTGIADGVNGLIYLFQGDFANAGISAAALIPYAGDAGKAARLANKATDLAKSEKLIKNAQKLYPQKAGKIENHHITPKYLGGHKNGPTIPLDGAYHQQITNEFRNLHPYGSPKPSSTELNNIKNHVYKKYPLPNK